MRDSIDPARLMIASTRIFQTFLDHTPADEAALLQVALPVVRELLNSPAACCGCLRGSTHLICHTSLTPAGDGRSRSAGKEVAANRSIKAASFLTGTDSCGASILSPDGGGESSGRIVPSGCLARTRWSDLWGPVLDDRQPILLNELDTSLNGSPRLAPALSVPLIVDDLVIGSLHVVYRSVPYSDSDLTLLQAIAAPLALLLKTCQKNGSPASSTNHDGNSTAVKEDSRIILRRALAEQETAAARAEESLQQLQATHRELLDETPAVIYVKDLQGRYEFINRRYEEVFHVTRADLTGRTDFDVFPADMAQIMQANDRRVASSAEPLQFQEIARHDDGEHIYFSVKFPLRDSQGQVRAVAGISTDITEQIETKRKLEAINRRYDLILDAVVDGVFGLDCSGCVTFINPAARDMLGWTERELLGQKIEQFIGASTACGAPRNVWTGPSAHGDPMPDVIMEDERTTFRTRTGETLPVASVSRPLYVSGELIGTVVTFRDLREELEREAASELRAELERREILANYQLHAVREIQLELLPKRIPEFAGFDLAARNYPQHIVSGDFYDFIVQADGSAIAVVGDASGHDLPAAVNMVEVHAALHTYLDCGVSLDRLMERLNRMLCRHLSGRFVSLFVTRFEPVTGRLEFAGAGHDATLLRAGGKVETLRSTGLVLGLQREPRRVSFETTTLAPGDLVFLPTDGFYEAQDPHQNPFGRKRVLECLREFSSAPAGEIIDHLRSAVVSHTHPFMPQDDMTAVIIRKT